MMFPIDYNGDVLNHNARVVLDGGIVESTDFLADFSEQTKRVNMPLLLDIYPNAAAAYSLRKLRTAYTGSAIRVRRSSDNAETDIGFNNAGDLDTSALMAFVGNGNGFVRTWYDQSGTNNHATQTGTTEQPVVVSGGTIVTNNNKPAIQWVGSGSRMSASSAVLASGTSLSAFYTYSTALAAAPDTNTVMYWFLGDGFTSNNILGVSAQSGALNGEYITIDVRRSSNSLERLGSSTYRRNSNTTVTENVFFLTGGTTLYQNRNLQSLNLTSAGANITSNYTPSNSVITGSLWLGAGFYSPSTYVSAQAKFSEFIFYTTNQSPNRIGIETNINSYYRIYQQEALLLDYYPDAAAAYSLRKLRSGYTGAAIQVRRSSDNAVQNIGFDSNGGLDTTALTTFVGTGNTGFVTTWYDQSGNNRNATQTGTTNQPVIVSGGTLITTNSKPSLNFDGAGDTFTATITPLLSYTNMTTFIINNPAAAAAPDTQTSILFGVDQGGANIPQLGLSFGGSTGLLTSEKFGMFFSSSTVNSGRLGSSTYNHNANEQTLFSIFNLSSGVAAYKNNSFITFDLAAAMTTSTPCAPANTNATNPLFHIGTINGASNGTLQKFQEVIVYPSNQSPNRIGIETNINSYYRIYQQEALLLDYYPDAAAAYSLRKLRSRYTGAAIQVRRSSDNAVQNIGFDSNGGLDTTALTTFVGTGNTGFVTTWYDQSGNNRNATQSTTANQPVIFSGGTVISENNKPSLLWHSSSVSLPLSDLSLTRNINNFYSTAVARNNLNTATSSRWIFLHSVNGADGSRALLGIFTPLVNYRTGGRRLDADAFQGADSSVVDDLSLKLYTSHLNYGGSDAFLWVNNSLVASNTNFLTDGNTADTLSKGSQIGNNNTNVEGWRGTIQELIHYTSNQSTNRPLIEANINSYYNIYVSENDAQSFIDAAAITNSTQRQAINKLVYDLKAYGLWYKMKAIYPFVGGTAASHKFNLKDPRDVDGAFRLVFNGGWTHSATGAKPDGSTGYANTFFNPFIQLGVTNAHQAFYNRMDVSNSIIINGCTSGLNNRFDFGFDSGRLPFHAIGNTNSSVGSAISSTAGFIFSTRTGTSSGFMQRNTTNIISVLPVFTSYASQNYFISARNVSGSATLFSLNEIAYFSLGDGLTDTEAANLYTAVQTFQTTLGRQV